MHSRDIPHQGQRFGANLMIYESVMHRIQGNDRLKGARLAEMTPYLIHHLNRLKEIAQRLWPILVIISSLEACIGGTRIRGFRQDSNALLVVSAPR